MAYKIDTTYPKDALGQLYRTENDGRLKERLLAIIHLYEGKNEGGFRMGQTLPEQCTWLAKALERRGLPYLKLELRGEPEPQLSAEQWDAVAEHVKGMSIRDGRQYVMERHQVNYSYDMVWLELRQKRKLPYCKPFMANDKMPADAQEQLKKR